MVLSYYVVYKTLGSNNNRNDYMTYKNLYLLIEVNMVNLKK